MKTNIFKPVMSLTLIASSALASGVSKAPTIAIQNAGSAVAVNSASISKATSGTAHLAAVGSDGTRGGGDPLALEFRATAEAALKNLQSMKRKPFSGVNIAQIQTKIDTAQVLVSDEVLAIAKDGITQDSAAENRPSQNLIILNRADYIKIRSAAVQQALALHEFLSLAGFESTGNYPISGQYLVAEGGASSGNANQTISSATKSVTAQTPCPEPLPDAGTLFAMIEDPNTPAAAVTSFIGTHLVAWDAYNDQCETTFLYSIDNKRYDIFQALYEHYAPDPSDPQPERNDSIYSFILESGDLTAFKVLKQEATEHQQSLSLDQTKGKGVTELMVALQGNPTLDLIQYLIQVGNDVNAEDAKGNTALLIAAYNDHCDSTVIQTLLRSGANVNYTSPSFYTVLQMSVGNPKNSLDKVLLLIQSGANVNAVASDGKTALILAIADNNTDEVIQALIQKGADVNVESTDGATALLAAAPLGSTNVIRDYHRSWSKCEAG